MERKQNKNSINKNLIIGTLIFIIILILLSGYSSAKYIYEYLIKSNNEIAKPILVVENDTCTEINSPNKSGIYNFKIKNYDESQKITDVNLQYKIEIKAKTEDLNFKLYENNKEIKLIDNITEYISISNKERQDKNYRLEISYDETDEEKMKDIIDQIQVKVHSEQIKG